MNKTLSAQFAPFLVLLAVILGVGLYVSDVGVETTRDAPAADPTSPSAEGEAPAVEPLTDPIPLGETVSNPPMGVELQIPEGWQATTEPEAVVLEDPNNPLVQMQVILLSADQIAAQLFGLPEVPEDTSPVGLLNAFAESVPTINPALQVEEPTTERTVSELEGATVLIAQTNPQTGQRFFIGVDLYTVPEEERLLATLLIGAPEQFEAMRTTLDNVLASIVFSEPEVTPTPEPTEAEPTEAPTEVEATATPEPTEAEVTATLVPTEEETDEPEPTATSEPEPTEAPTDTPVPTADETTEEDTAEPEPTATPEEEPTEAAAEAVPLSNITFNNRNTGLTVTVPEGFQVRNRGDFLFVELDDTTIRFTIDEVAGVATQQLGLESDDVPNDDVAVNLLRQLIINVEADYEVISGLTVSNAGQQAYVDLTRADVKRRVVLRQLDDDRLLFVELIAPLDDFEQMAATLLDMLAVIEIE